MSGNEPRDRLTPQQRRLIWLCVGVLALCAIILLFATSHSVGGTHS